MFAFNLVSHSPVSADSPIMCVHYKSHPGKAMNAGETLL